MTIVRVLSVRQPWAELILSGRKDIEIRTWKTNYRGRVFIHAGKQVDKEALNEMPAEWIPQFLPIGYLLGFVELVEIKAYDRTDFERDKERHYNDPKWYNGRQYGWVFRKHHKIVPLEMKGKLRLFKADIDTVEISKGCPVRL